MSECSCSSAAQSREYCQVHGTGISKYTEYRFYETLKGADMKNEFLELASQLWCLPQHEKKVMDVEFALSIAKALESQYKRGKVEMREAVLLECKRLQASYSTVPIDKVLLCEAIRNIEI